MHVISRYVLELCFCPETSNVPQHSSIGTMFRMGCPSHDGSKTTSIYDCILYLYLYNYIRVMYEQAAAESRSLSGGTACDSVLCLT